MLFEAIAWILQHRIAGSFLVALLVNVIVEALKGKTFIGLLGFPDDPVLSLLVVWFALYILFPKKSKYSNEQSEFKYKDINEAKVVFFEVLYDAIQKILSKRGVISYPTDYDGIAITLWNNADFFSSYGDTIQEAVNNFLNEFLPKWEKGEIDPIQPTSMDIEVYKFNSKKAKSEIIHKIKVDPLPFFHAADGKIG